MTATLSPQVDRLVGEDEAANFLGVKAQTLACWRSAGRYSLPFCKIGRAVRYRLSDLQAFADSRRVTSTGEADSL